MTFFDSLFYISVLNHFLREKSLSCLILTLVRHFEHKELQFTSAIMKWQCNLIAIYGCLERTFCRHHRLFDS